nr:tetratricopeptide repeat protein [Lacrimispora amygdalina]
MDKYEFNIKVEQIKKMVSRGDYGTAMKIADTIDWHRVRNASLLSMIAQIYEKNEEYQEAKDILLLAFERAPVGKRLLYKLADLALKDGSTAEAEAYYREFCDLAQDDPRQYLLRYKILKVKKAPVDQLIRALEVYTASEVDEKWLYELADLYHKAGIEDKCVATCDRIMLLFGLGKYVDKAMDLKLQYAPLNKYQMDLVENRDKYEAKLRAVEEEYSGNAPELDDYDEGTPDSEVSKQVAMQIHEDAQTKKLADEMSRLSEEEGRTAVVEEDDDMGATRTIADLSQVRRGGQAAAPEVQEEENTIPTGEDREIERQKLAIRAAKEREEMEEEALRRAEEEREAARREEEERRAKKQAEIDRERARRNQVRNIPAPEEEDDDGELELESLDDMLDTNNLMIEAETDEEGLSMAVSSLREIHRELGIKNPVAKISSEKLNKRGISAVADMLAGKDLIIQHAAGLTDAVQNELDDLMEKDRSGMIVVLIDTPENLEALHAHNTSLASKFQYIGSDENASAQKEADTEMEAALKRSTEKQEQIARDVVNAEQETEEEPEQEDAEALQEEPEYEKEETDILEESSEPETDEEDEEEPEPEEYVPPKKAKLFAKQEKPQKKAPVTEEEPELPEETASAAEEEVVPEDYDDKEEMDPDEFAQYACKYATEIDCSITGKSLLALYERIEMMEEDEVRLTKAAAVDLIEEAADKAEKKSLGKKVAGLFSPTYTKEGLLILHEKDFFD